MISDQTVITLFAVFARRWTHKWERTNADPHARDVWLTDLRNLGVTDETAGRGLVRSATLDWPPSPAEFAALCVTNEDLGMPPLEEVADRIISAVLSDYRVKVHKFSKPVYAVWRSIHSVYQLRLSDEREMRKQIQRAYERVLSDIRAGKELPEVPEALPSASSGDPLPKEEAIKRMASLKAMLDNNNTETAP